jgi:Kef-type K+ transport system membrane component KefB
MRKLGFPQVLGFIVAGILIGPAIWGAIFPLNGSELFPITSGEHNPYLKAFAEVGVIFVMFTAGLETDLEEIKKTGFAAFMIALAGVLVPLGAGTLLASIFLPQLTWHSWIFVGTIMTATSVGITVEVLRELGKLKTKIGTIIMNAAVIDDVLGIMVLSVVLSISGGNTASNNLLGVINPNNIPVISILWILQLSVSLVKNSFSIMF